MKALEVPIKLQSTSKKIEKDLAIQLFMNRYLFIYLKKKKMQYGAKIYDSVSNVK